MAANEEAPCCSKAKMLTTEVIEKIFEDSDSDNSLSELSGCSSYVESEDECYELSNVEPCFRDRVLNYDVSSFLF